MADLSECQSTLNDSREQLLNCSNVVATGIGYKVTGGKKTETLCMVCSVTRKLPLSQLGVRDRVPALLQGVPTDVVETGPMRIQQSRTGRKRPAPGGVSIGHRDITAGTLGCVVRRNGEGNDALYILSNNHVLANSNSGEIGDPILQPGPVDGGTLADDRIAELADFAPIEFQEAPGEGRFAAALIAALNAGCRLIGSPTRYRAVRLQQQDNLVDSAIAQVVNPQAVTREILDIGEIAGVGRGELGDRIKKSGRTTGLTSGEIQQVDVTVDVQFGEGHVARFSDQLLAGPMSQGGDSGSVVLDSDNRLIGLLFAGSDNSTVINRIEHVFSILDVSL